MLLAVSLVLTACVFAMAEENDPSNIAPPTSEAPNEDGSSITVSFDGNGSTAGEMAELTVGADGKVTLPAVAFTKDLYDFTGWNTVYDGSGVSYEDGAEITVTESITLYAQWVRKGVVLEWVRVTYDANGGEGEVVDDFDYMPDNEVLVAFNDFTREGYTFKEWNTKADGTGTAYAEEDTFVITEDVTLYAIWVSNTPDPVDPAPSEDEPAPSEEEKPVVSDEDNTETEKPAVDDTPVTDTDANPKTGDTVATTVALAAGIVALGAFVVLKKKN